METLKQKQKEFKNLVNDYRRAIMTMNRMIVHDSVDQGDRDNEKNTKEQVIEAYRKFSKNNIRYDLLFIAIRTMSDPVPPRSYDYLIEIEYAKQLTNWLRDLGVKLVNELEGIH